MAYSDRLLSDGEDVLVDLRPHPVLLVAPISLVAAAGAGAVTIAVEFPGAPVAVGWLLAAMVVIPALWLVARLVRWRATHFVVTPNRLVYRRGILRRNQTQLRLQRVVEVHCVQTLLDRVVGSGRLVFEVSTEDPLAVDDVRRPRSVQRLVTECIDELARQPLRLVSPDAPGAAVARGVAGRPAPWLGEETPPHGVPLVADEPTTPYRSLSDRWHDGSATGAPTVVAAPGTISAQLIELDGLRRRGILTDDEFAQKKAELLRRI